MSSTSTTTLTLPPQYETPPNEAESSGDESELPAYALPIRHRTRIQTLPTLSAEHIYERKTSKGVTWAELRLKSGASSATNQLPTYWEGQNVVGTVNLHLTGRESIRSVKVTLTAQVVTGAEGVFPFLKIKKKLWSRRWGDPNTSTPPTEGSPTRTQSSFTDKLVGDYSWPFELEIPSEVSLAVDDKAPTITYKLPQTFLERSCRVNIQYELTIDIAKIGLRPRSRISTRLAYIPCIRPSPPSQLRRLAYQEGQRLLGPEVDPEGWKNAPFNIKATLFKTRPVEVNAVLSLAAPICYTRGSPLALLIELSSGDLQAVDVIASQAAIDVRLRRTVRYYDSFRSGPSAIPVQLSYKTLDSDWTKEVSFEGSVKWLPREAGDALEEPDKEKGETVYKRKLVGEIPLKLELKPTTKILGCTIDYEVVVMFHNNVAFTTSSDKELLHEKVEIATLYADGPRPRAYAPPEYQVPTPRPSIDTLIGVDAFGF